MKKVLSSVLKDEIGQHSTKRLLAIIGTLFLCVIMAINAFCPKTVNPSPELIMAVEIIVCSCVGATSLDKFALTMRSKVNANTGDAPTEDSSQL